jgi:uncharacterized protein (DUF58 family)
MRLREVIGLLLVIVGLSLLPAAWAFSRLLWALAFMLLLAGFVLFYTERMAKKEEKLEKETGRTSSHRKGTAVPTDIHNYTGWRSGGRSETMDHSVESSDGDAD